MGGFYGSVQVKCEERALVRQAAEQVAAARGIRCLAGPLIDGWVGVYPQDSGQDQTVGEAIARKTSGDVFHLIVHDDDVFAYWFWSDGELADSYWSAPGYFGEEQRHEQETMAGRPEAYAHLLGGRIGEVRELLKRDMGSFTFEYERLERFAKCLGIRNAVAAYEYLMEGERTGIQGWREFEEVPAADIQKAQSAAQERRRQLNDEQRRLKKTGLLLATKSAKNTWYRACAVDGGFLLGSDGIPRGKAAMLHFAPPWSKPALLDLGLTMSPDALASDPVGRRVAVAAGNSIRIWATHGWKPVCELDGASDVALSFDGERVVQASMEKIIATDTRTGRAVRSVSVASARHPALHPSGHWITVAAPADGLLLIPMDPNVDNRFVRVGDATEDGREIVMCVGFSRNGHWLWCGTSRAMYLFEWECLMGDGYRSATPVRSYVSPECCDEYTYLRGYIYTIVDEPEGREIIFGGVSGILRRMELGTGQVRDLLRLPEHEAIVSLYLTPEGKTLGMISSTLDPYEPRKQRNTWQVWSYERLKQCDQPVVLG